MLTNCSSLTRRFKSETSCVGIAAYPWIWDQYIWSSICQQTTLSQVFNVFPFLDAKQTIISQIPFKLPRLSSYQRQHSATNVTKALDFEKAGWPGSEKVKIFTNFGNLPFCRGLVFSCPFSPKKIIILNFLLKLLQPFVPFPALPTRV